MSAPDPLSPSHPRPDRYRVLADLARGQARLAGGTAGALDTCGTAPGEEIGSPSAQPGPARVARIEEPPARAHPAAGGRVGEVGRVAAGGTGGRRDGAGHPGGLTETLRRGGHLTTVNIRDVPLFRPVGIASILRPVLVRSREPVDAGRDRSGSGADGPARARRSGISGRPVGRPSQTRISPGLLTPGNRSSPRSGLPHPSPRPPAASCRRKRGSAFPSICR